ncbi:hypothetical protein [Mucisphaera sp.]|uniref:hypothetical protein n=1 Tax=Mucisphaera sp. TaxID=2913024 RepID=UPI003D0EAB92
MSGLISKAVAALCLAVTACWLCLGQSVVAAQELDQVLVNPKRLVHLFDFEETNEQGLKIGASFDLPMHWYAVGRDPLNPDQNFLNQPVHAELIERRGFPSFAEVGFGSRYASSGDYAMRLRLDGGNAGAFLQVGALPVLTRSDYMITARVRTEKIERASARIRAYFVDDRGNRVPGSERVTAALSSEGGWTPISIKLIGRHPEAAWIGLELELLQPTPSADDPLGQQQIVLEDLDAEFWVDDIGVWLLPHVEIGTQSPTNLVVSPDRPEVHATVRDLTGQLLRVELGVFNEARERVAQRTWVVGGGSSDSWTWQPDLPGYGWYLLELSVFEAEGVGAAQHHRFPLARSIGAVAYLPGARPRIAPDLSRFTLLAEDIPEGQRLLLPDILERTGLRSVVLSVWQEDTTLETLNREQQELERLLRVVMSNGRRVGLSFSPVPKALSLVPGVETTSPLTLLRTSADLWRPFVAPVMMRHGQRVKDWHLGALDPNEPFFVERLDQTSEQITNRLRNLSPSPRLHLPWRIDQARRADMPMGVAYTIEVPESVGPDGLEAYVTPWLNPPLSHSLRLVEPDAQNYPHRQRLSSLARRMVMAWVAGASGLSLDRPWTSAFERDGAILPDPLLPAFSNIAQQLAERRYVTRLNLGGQRQAVVFDGEPGSLMVLWDRENASSPLDLYLGRSPEASDIWGNRSLVAYDGRKHRLSLGEVPTFVEGVDVDLARLRASFEIDEPFIESMQIVHDRRLRMTNPFPVTMQGMMRFVGPEGWRIEPAQHVFVLDPGASMELPIGMSFPIQEISGDKELVAHLTFTTDRNYDIDLKLPLQLGLRDLLVNSSLSIVPNDRGGLDAVAIMIVTNQAEDTRSFYGFATMRGQRGLERIISRLNSGQTVVERFRFRDVEESIEGTPIRLGVREARGPSILNKRLSFNDAFDVSAR